MIEVLIKMHVDFNLGCFFQFVLHIMLCDANWKAFDHNVLPGGTVTCVVAPSVAQTSACR